MSSLRDILIPSRDWRVRIYSVYVFILFDYIMTAFFCDTFSEEGNIVLRFVMIQLNDIVLGLVFFALLFYGAIYIILCYFSNRVQIKEMGLTGLIYYYRRPLFDIVIGLGVGARHFEGGMSWVLPLHNRLWLALGFIFYLTTVHIGTLIQMFK